MTEFKHLVGETQIILVHLGDALPVYIDDCIAQVVRFGNQPLLIADAKHQIAERPIIGEATTAFDSIGHSILKEHFWVSAFRRLFILEDFMKAHSLTNIVHIENDVLLYHDPRKLDFSLFGDCCAATILGQDYMTFAYFWIPNVEALHRVNAAALQVLKNVAAGKTKLRDETTNEMLVARKLYTSGQLKTFPILPGDQYTDYFGMVFDPASYGQYLGGTRSDPPGYTGSHHYIGDAIQRGDLLAPKMSNGRPFIGHTPIANLHVHCKDLRRFME